MTELLTKEILKPKLKDSVLKARKCIFYEPSEEERDIGKITMIIRNMPEFKKFIKFNNIDHDSIRMAANYMEYVKFPKGVYIFKQGEPSKMFYGVINGTVSIRIEEKKVMNVASKKIYCIFYFNFSILFFIINIFLQNLNIFCLIIV